MQHFTCATVRIARSGEYLIRVTSSTLFGGPDFAEKILTRLVTTLRAMGSADFGTVAPFRAAPPIYVGRSVFGSL